jgi:hypothetical protein
MNMTEMIDANGYEIDLRTRGLRICTHCKLVMSEGWYGDGDYACSSHCLDAQRWQMVDASIGNDGITTILTSFNLDLLEEPENEELFGCVYWTDWEADESDDEAIERLHASPYSMNLEDLHQRGAHDDRSEVECNYCKQLFPSSHDDAIAEAIELGLEVI